MSQDYHHQSLFNFSNGFDRSQAEQQQHMTQQIRRDKLRGHGFDAGVPFEEETSGLPVYETAGMLSEMFNFPPGTATELLESPFNTNTNPNPNPRVQMHSNEWFGNRIHAADSAAAMQLFLMNPQPKSPSPSPPSTSSTLHMLLPNPAGGSFGQFTGTHQGLSLSLSSSLQHKAEELRMTGEGEMLFFNQGGTTTNSAEQFRYKNNNNNMNSGQNLHQVHVGYGSSLGMVNALRNSKYAKAAQELLEEFCSVGRGKFKKNKTTNPNSNPNNNNSSKDVPPLTAADRIEHQRRKVKLLSMLDEVDRRYNHYCEQMQMVVNSFDLVMGFGAAIPYTALAQKAMSRHFRCLKEAITTQLKHSCELLGDKDAGSSGITKGETPRLKLLEQSLRQQRAFHQMGMMEQEAWRPQRGLPERSVNILRAWLFEHFLHPYPSDADKHLLARQTGLSRNQVSNWFINARVRLWKPMVEDMYQQEAKEEDDDDKSQSQNSGNNNSSSTTTTPTPTITTGLGATETGSAVGTATILTRSEFNAPDNDASLVTINSFSENQAKLQHSFQTIHHPDAGFRRDPDPGSTLIRFGTTTGDVSLTLGLHHAGNLPENTHFFG